MLEHQMHLHAESLRRELREIALQRPRYDRPDYGRPGRLRAFLRTRAHPPARAAFKPGKPIPNVTIRPARAADLHNLARLAEISERRVPSGLVLVAEVESSIVAARAVQGGPVLSDLRRPTGDVVQLLELRSEQIRAATGSSRAA